MIEAGLSAEYERELARVVERVRTMPLTRLSTSSDSVYALCCSLADLAKDVGSGLAGGLSVPRLGDHGLPDQLQVLGMELATVADTMALGRAHALLVDMRKALP